MILFIVKRFLAAIFVLIAVSFLSFMVLNLAPGDSAVTVLTHTFVGFDDFYTDSDIEAVSNIFGLGKPLIVQYLEWFSGFFVGNFGNSFVYNKPVMGMVFAKLPYTLILGLSAFAVALIISVPIGMFLAKRKNGVADQIARVITVLMSSVPGFWLSLVFIIIFSVTLGWTPVRSTLSFSGVILPGLVMMISMIPTTLRITRATTSDILSQDYMITAKIKGLTESQSMIRHGFRNSLTPIITVSGLEIGHILGGSVIIENIFGWPGIGGLLYNSILAKDYPMMQGCIFVIALGYIVTMFLVDIVTAIVDPRMRLAGGK